MDNVKIGCKENSSATHRSHARDSNMSALKNSETWVELVLRSTMKTELLALSASAPAYR